jgi:predicted DNA-binding transcriptional regulator YafY
LKHKDANPRHEKIASLLAKGAKKRAVLLKDLNAELPAEKKIGLTQLGKDITWLIKEKKAPIEIYKDGKAHCYRLTRPWTLKGYDLEDEDIVNVINFISAGLQIEALNIIPGLKDTLASMAGIVETHYNSEKRRLAFETGMKADGHQFISTIYKSLIAEKTITVHYKKFGEKECQPCIVHPYLLKYYDHRYYLYCLTEGKGERQYGLDRIVKIGDADVEFIPCDYDDPEEFYKSIIGVTNDANAPVQKIVLLFTNPMNYYQETWGWHTSQKILKEFPDGSLLVTYDLKINPELIARLQSVSDSVRVLAPLSLKETIISKAQSVVDLYKTPVKEVVVNYCENFYFEKGLRPQYVWGEMEEEKV